MAGPLPPVLMARPSKKNKNKNLYLKSVSTSTGSSRPPSRGRCRAGWSSCPGSRSGSRTRTCTRRSAYTYTRKMLKKIVDYSTMNTTPPPDPLSDFFLYFLLY